MSDEFWVLVSAAASIGFLHTLFGPDHYLPFIVISKARGWSSLKTAFMTVLCGIGHVGSSVVIGLIGASLGIAVGKIRIIEEVRGNIAAWLFIAFGLVYFVWGVRNAIRNRPHSHIHTHGSVLHNHSHRHNEEHLHPHLRESKVNLTPWILFTIFVFGPCEPLIPILMYPAMKNSVVEMALVTMVFSAVTIFTMTTIVMLSYFGIRTFSAQKAGRYMHAIAGAALLICGLGIQFLGL